MGWATSAPFEELQENLYADGGRVLPYYYRQYPSLLAHELDPALFPGVTYHQYSQPSVPGFHPEGL